MIADRISYLCERLPLVEKVQQLGDDLQKHLSPLIRSHAFVYSSGHSMSCGSAEDVAEISAE